MDWNLGTKIINKVVAEFFSVGWRKTPDQQIYVAACATLLLPDFFQRGFVMAKSHFFRRNEPRIKSSHIPWPIVYILGLGICIKHASSNSTSTTGCSSAPSSEKAKSPFQSMEATFSVQCHGTTLQNPAPQVQLGRFAASLTACYALNECVWAYFHRTNIRKVHLGQMAHAESFFTYSFFPSPTTPRIVSVSLPMVSDEFHLHVE